MQTLKNKVVLVVDDDERNVFAINSFLETLDMNIAVAGNGHDAIESLRQGPLPDIILLDMMMPLLDGFETLRILKQDNLLDKIPVIAVTAKAMKGDREKCLEAGAWDYISKPVDLGLLTDKLKKWVV